MDVTTIPVPTTEAGIGTLRVPIPADDPLLAEALVASASIISDFEDSYLNELTDAVEQSLRSIRQMVVGRLRARATIVTPVAASGAQFANPWHDEIGRFAPKGTGRQTAIETWGTDRPVTSDGNRHWVKSATGTLVMLTDDNGDSDPELISDLLNGAADAHDLSPDSVTAPQIILASGDQLVSRLEAIGYNTARLKLGRLGAVVGRSAPNTIVVNSEDILHDPGPGFFMPSAYEMSLPRYRMMHEYAHTRMYNGLDDERKINEMHSPRPGISKYGQGSGPEAHAEAFAEWAAHGGTLDRDDPNVTMVVREYARTFRWNRGLGRIEPDETFTIGQFMNPWHDEIGRFAPKGYGRLVKVIGDEHDHRSGLNGIADLDFRYQPDLDRRATQIWQQEFYTNWAVKRIARNLVEGKEPFDDVELDEGLVERYTQRNSRSTAETYDYTEEDLRNDLVAAAEWAALQPTIKGPPLYRGLMMDETKLHAFFKNRDIPLDFVSASPDKAEAAMYSSPFGSRSRALDPVRVMMTIQNAEAVDLAPFVVGRMHGSRERLMRGRGRITSMEKDQFGIWQIVVDAAAEEALAASIGPDDADILAILDQPFHFYDEYGAVVATGATFANPWHDEIGRFAPKGTGVKRLGPKTLNDDPRSYEKVDLLDDEAVRDSLEAYAVDITQRINETHPDQGLELTLADMEGTGPPDNEYMATFLLQDDTGDIVAHMDRHIEFDKASAYAAGLQVDDELQGQGIGTMLQESFEDWASSQDLAAMKVYAIDVGRYAWMRAGYDWANTDGFHEIANLLGQGNPAAESFRRSVIAGEVLEETPTPYELSKMLSRDQILSREFPNWDGIKPLRTRALAAAATAPREERLAKVRDAWKIWAREYPAAAEGYVVDPEAEAAWAALMGEDDGLVAAGPFDLDDFNVMTPEEWAAAFDVEAADIVGDVVVDAATGQALRPGLNVSDQIITDLIDRHIGRLQGLGPLVQASIRDALHLAVRNQLTLDDVIREIQATGPLGETAARAIARTELTAATNGGMLTGWKRDGFPFKEWKSLHDERVRHAHLEADGQVVPTEQEFEVGGFRAQYPGDPRLPVHLRINCRCYMDRIGEDGQTLNTRLVDSTRAQLYRLAQELNIPGRSKMRKDDLFQAIDRYRNGFGYTSLEEMNRAQLLIRARMAGIVGRSRMTKPELMIRLRALATGRNRDRWLIDAGHGTREQLAAVQAQLREDLRVLIEGPIPAIIAAGPPPTVEKIDIIRRKVFRRYGGADTGTAMCVGCGARLHWSNSTRWEQMTLIRLNSKHTWSSKNAMPVCLACAPKLAKMTTEKISTTFTIDSWETIAELFTPGWSKILGQFSTG